MFIEKIAKVETASDALLSTKNPPYFYRKLGLVCSYGGENAPFTTMSSEKTATVTSNAMHINIFSSEFPPAAATKGDASTLTTDATPTPWNQWGRFIVFVEDVDAIYRTCVENGIPSTTGPPTDAVWGERYFHIRDPMGHELSLAAPIEGHERWNGEKRGGDDMGERKK